MLNCAPHPRDDFQELTETVKKTAFSSTTHAVTAAANPGFTATHSAVLTCAPYNRSVRDTIRAPLLNCNGSVYYLPRPNRVPILQQPRSHSLRLERLDPRSPAAATAAVRASPVELSEASPSASLANSRKAPRSNRAFRLQRFHSFNSDSVSLI